jgi:hypothetical protein
MFAVQMANDPLLCVNISQLKWQIAHCGALLFCSSIGKLPPVVHHFFAVQMAN